MRISSLKKKAFTAVLLGVAAILFYGCLNPVGNGKSPDGGLLSANGDYIPATGDTSYFATKVQPIFTSQCVTCHNPSGTGFAATGLDLSTGSAYLNLLGADGTGKVSSEIPPTLRVKSGNPDSSYLYQKISLPTPKFGGRMPLGGTLSSDQIAIIKTWIQNGAKQ